MTIFAERYYNFLLYTKACVIGEDVLPRVVPLFREWCTPTWVKNAKAEEMTDEQIDAVTGATPKESGIQTYTWDFKDADGKEVPAGNYKICFEATLYFNSILLYTGTFSTNDKAGDIALTSTLTEEDEAHKNMVTEVKAALK